MDDKCEEMCAYAVVVLSSEEPRCQRRPDGCAVLVLLVNRRIFHFEAFAVESYTYCQCCI